MKDEKSKGEAAVWDMVELVLNEARTTARNHPEMARHIATGLLGIGCAFADTYGVDAVAFVTSLRDQRKD